LSLSSFVFLFHSNSNMNPIFSYQFLHSMMFTKHITVGEVILSHALYVQCNLAFHFYYIYDFNFVLEKYGWLWCNRTTSCKNFMGGNPFSSPFIYKLESVSTQIAYVKNIFVVHLRFDL
jgi:hypothetical protein